MDISLKGKRAIVGGSSQGIGKAIALQLAECGAEITLMARNEEKLKKVVTELSVQSGQKHSYLLVDFSDYEDFKIKISNYFETNRIDILINNTNGPSAGTVFEKNTDDYQVAFDLLFKTVNFITMAALKEMQNKNYGRIINVSSVSTREPIQNLVLSNSIRTAVLSWAKTLARDIAPFGITVNNILTGYFDTERLQALNQFRAEKNGVSFEEQRQLIISEVPMKRIGKPEEFGYLAAFLASEKASYITGTNIPIDGGLLKSI